MARTIGSFEDFKKVLPANWAVGSAGREEAVRTYLAMGGVTKIGDVGASGWPKLVYPGVERLERQIRHTERKTEDIDRKIANWHRRKKHLKTNKITDMIRTVAEPLYWEHHAKMVVDPTYRETALLVGPPMHLIHRTDWKKRLGLFVKDKEYRIRMHEARTSQIGRKREAMSKEVEKRMQFSRELAEAERQKLLDKKEGLVKKKAALLVMLTWAKETS